MAVIRYLVDDVDVCVGFYARLGFEIAERRGAPFAVLRRGDLDLWLSGPGTSARRPMADGTEPGPGGWNRLVIGMPNLAAVVEALGAVGVRFLSRPVSGPGGTQVLCEDPAGNLVELFEPAG